MEAFLCPKNVAKLALFSGCAIVLLDWKSTSKEKKMRRALFVITLLSIAAFSGAVEEKSSEKPFWEEFYHPEVEKVGGTALIAVIEKTRTICGVLAFPKDKLVITADIETADGHYRFLGLIKTIIRKDNRGREVEEPILQQKVEVEVTKGLWMLNADNTPKLFERYCHKDLLLQLPLSIQRLFHGFFGVGGGVKI